MKAYALRAPNNPNARVHVQKCLNTLDLTSLGIGSCCGTGMYLVAGMVAQKIAGPGVIISFIIAAIASIFSGESAQIVWTNFYKGDKSYVLSSVLYNTKPLKMWCCTTCCHLSHMSHLL